MSNNCHVTAATRQPLPGAAAKPDDDVIAASVSSVIRSDGSSTRNPDGLSRDLVKLADAMNAADCAVATVTRRGDDLEREFNVQLNQHRYRYNTAQNRATENCLTTLKQQQQ